MSLLNIFFTIINHVFFIVCIYFLFKKKIFSLIKVWQREEKKEEQKKEQKIEEEKLRLAQAKELLKKREEKYARYSKLMKCWREGEDIIYKKEAEYAKTRQEEWKKLYEKKKANQYRLYEITKLQQFFIKEVTNAAQIKCSNDETRIIEKKLL